MSAPLLWIILPFALSGLLLLIRDQKVTLIIACVFTLFLTLAAWLLPIETTLTVRGWSFKFASSIVILGRKLSITSADRSILALIYGSTFCWFIPAAFLRTVRRLVPLGLAIASLLVGALAVEPSLYAALIIEVAVILSVPMLMTPRQKPTKGVIRFLIFQTLAVPFILLSGWLITGIGANPGNLALVQQAATLLGFGFAFLLAIFPFYTWIPMLAEEANPYITGFLLWILPTAAMFYGLSLLDRYNWLRDAPGLPVFLTIIGVLMVVIGGILSVFQRHLGRIMGYAIMVETGYSLLAIGSGSQTGVGIFLLLLIPRALCICLWALTLTILKETTPSLSFKDVEGLGTIWPFATSALVLTNLALAGMPLLAGFPSHQAVWEALAHVSLPLTFWALVGSLGFFISAFRVLATLTNAPQGTIRGTRETPIQRLFIITGLVGLFILGLFPQWVLPLWTKLPGIFVNLGH
jgi:NADH-quinone oxidoreductase subunit N